MAEEEKAEDEVPKPKRNMMVLILVAVNVLLLAGGGVYFMFFMGGDEAAAPADAEAEAAMSPEGRFGPLVEFNPIVANLADGDATRYVKVTLHMEVGNEEQQLQLTDMMIPVRDRMVLHFSGLTAEQTVGEAQKSVIKEQLVALVNEVVGAELVRKVYFGEFVVQ